MQAENRVKLIDASPRRDEVSTAFRDLDTYARSQFVLFGGQRMTLHDVLAHPRNERTDPLHVVVHPEMPWQESGRAFLKLRAEFASGEYRSEQPPHEIAECWRGIFQAELHKIIAGHQASSVVIHDPHSVTPSPIKAPMTLHSTDVGQQRQTGLLPPQSLAALLERFGSLTDDTGVRIHGTSFGSCPTGSALQLAAAAVYGTYFPDQTNETSMNRQRDILIQAMGQSNVLRMHTRIRMGTLLDYTGMHALLQSNPHFAGIFRIFDEQTQVIPDRNAALMHAADLRK